VGRSFLYNNLNSAVTSVVRKKAPLPQRRQVSVLALQLAISTHHSHIKALDIVRSTLNDEKLLQFNAVTKRFSHFFTIKSLLLGILLMSDKSAITDMVFNDMQPLVQEHLHQQDIRERPFGSF
jgi:hypothetical protein